jgi:hypothetical protein
MRKILHEVTARYKEAGEKSSAREQLTTAAEAAKEGKRLIVALKRCATQNQTHN